MYYRDNTPILPFTAMASSSSSSSAPKQPDTFEFTKRKRWAHLLVTELADAIMLVLSPSCKVLYCGPAVTELLGWKDEEVIDIDLFDLLNGVYNRLTRHTSTEECFLLLLYSRRSARLPHKHQWIFTIEHWTDSLCPDEVQESVPYLGGLSYCPQRSHVWN